MHHTKMTSFENVNSADFFAMCPGPFVYRIDRDEFSGHIHIYCGSTFAPMADVILSREGSYGSLVAQAILDSLNHMASLNKK